MYERADTWLPTARQMGMGQITFTDLRRASRRARGFGQAIVAPPASGIAPGSPCYDPSHDNGENHCASFTSVIASAFGAGPAQTTTCSQAEQACLQGGAVANPSITGLLTPAQQSVNAAAQPDVCTANWGVSCTTTGLIVLAALILIPLLTAGRRF